MDQRHPIFSLEYLPLLVRLTCLETARLPAFLGSTLHGVVGWALQSHRETYTYLFENRRLGGAKQDIVNPYMLEPPRPRSVYHPGDELSFKLVLFGHAINYAERVVTALANTNTFKLGAERRSFKLEDILHAERFFPVWREGHVHLNSITPVNIHSVATRELAHWCSIHLLTPVRIRRGGELVRHIDFPTIIRGGIRRIETLTERYGGFVDRDLAVDLVSLATEVKETSSGLYLNEMHRYSNRKSESVDWSGMLGAMTFEGELSAFTPWLNAVRILHIGRNTTFGCGQLDVVYR